MSLINCPSCHREISPNAAACPHCGEPMCPHLTDKPTNVAKVIGSLLLVVGIVVAVADSSYGWPMMAAGFVLFVISRFKD